MSYDKREIPDLVRKPDGGVATYNSDALRDVVQERIRQIDVESWDPSHDDSHDDGSLARAAGCYALADLPVDIAKEAFPYRFPGQPKAWPWHADWWKPKTPRENLIRAGALIIAEIERIDRQTATQGEG